MAKTFARKNPGDIYDAALLNDQETWLEYVIPNSAGEMIVGTGDGTQPSRLAATTVGLAAVDGHIRDGWYEPMALTTGGNTTAAATASSVYLYRFQVPAAGNVTQIAVVCGAAGGLQDYGIYGRAGAGNYTLLGHTGQVLPSAGTAVVSTINLLAGVPVVLGTDYFFGFGGDNATTTYLRWTLSGNTPTFGEAVMGKATAYSAGLPGSINAMGLSNFTPWYALHIV